MFGITVELCINICRCICLLALRKSRIHVGSTHGSSVYLIKYVLVVSICCCRALGSSLISSYHPMYPLNTGLPPYKKQYAYSPYPPYSGGQPYVGMLSSLG